MEGKLQKATKNAKMVPLEDGVDHLEFFLKAGQGQLFATFLETEYSVENIFFWKEVEEFREKHKRDDSGLAVAAQSLFDRFISFEAPQSINISSETRIRLTEALKTPSVDMFDGSQKIIYELMKNDTFPRFQHKSAEMLQESWNRMCKKPKSQLGISFYTILFTTWPEGEKMFHGGLKGISKKGGKDNHMLITLVGSCINLMGDLKTVITLIRAAAKRHVGYGVKFEHFNFIGNAFMIFVQKEDADHWNPKVEAAWRNLYTIISGMMIAGMSEARSQATFQKTVEHKLAKETRPVLPEVKSQKYYFSALGGPQASASTSSRLGLAGTESGTNTPSGQRSRSGSVHSVSGSSGSDADDDDPQSKILKQKRVERVPIPLEEVELEDPQSRILRSKSGGGGGDVLIDVSPSKGTPKNKKNKKRSKQQPKKESKCCSVCIVL